MNIARIIFLVCFGAIFWLENSYGQSAKVVTSLTADTIMLGDQILLQVDIDKDASSDVGLPDFKDGKMTDKIEIVGVPRVDTLSHSGRQVKLRVSYTITSFDAGSYALQGFPFVLHHANGSVDTLKSNTVNYLYVKTFDIDTTKQQIFDIKDPIQTPLIFAEVKDYVLWGFVLALILAVILYFVIRWFRNHKISIANKPKEPAHIIAIKALEALNHRKMWQSGNIKEYYSVLSDILRQYIEDRYDIWAMEMTTQEIIDSVKEINSSSQIETLREFMMLSDLAKFAKWSPDNVENIKAWDDIYEYVEQTKIMVVNTEDK